MINTVKKEQLEKQEKNLEAEADALVGVGRDVETQVLSRAVRWHSEHRVMLNDTRTVVFR